MKSFQNDFSKPTLSKSRLAGRGSFETGFMLSEINKHMAHYFSLAGIVLVSLWGVFSFPYDQAFQSVIVMSFGVAFVFWGLVHHHIHQDLHPKIILEYVATAILGVIILLSIIWKV